MTKLLLTPAEAAEQLGLGRSTVYELLATGELESICIGRARRIPHDALVAYVGRLRGGRAGAA
ncbi:helix-turn-helix domain-containing protein [Pseudofrankia sp. BMG5.37]|uniref:helix-turn-helix domain-containing protein n=1 Tax=Pseudofrankia sp. BMG5.37 TaxID=3050035 RepID=UPI002893EEE7|nr:helix-turn-helix domain-containing protein [Pseudofrankia sp. BMG5.37]MDT3444276.1 helix-turn-helix domain-containing protein [Pseudofrankia sp. BMG5.37]